MKPTTRITFDDLLHELDRIKDMIEFIEDNIENVIEDEWQNRYEEAKDDLRAEIEEELGGKK